MEEAVASGRGRWSTAAALTLAVLLLSVFDALAMVLLPLAILMVGWPAERRIGWIVAGLSLWVIGVLVTAGGLALLARGWALLLGVAFLSATMARPEWPVISRGLAAAGFAAVIGGVGLMASGRAGELDVAVRAHFANVSNLTSGDLERRLPDTVWTEELRTATERIGELQAQMFPALLGLQSLAALALAAWWIRRLGRSRSRAFELAPFREFRFHDELIWALIGGILLMVMPLGPAIGRLGANLVLFMGALYALRGVAVYVFMLARSRSVPAIVVSVLVVVFLYPLAMSAAVVMGVGDTWLDVRRRGAVAKPS
jgi:hypothetical protein